MTLLRKAGTTDVSVVIRIIDSTAGTPETGVVWNTAGIDLEYRREGAVSVDITEATLAALTDAHSDGGFLHIGNGYYRLDLPDAACAAGVTGVLIHGTVTGMVVIGEYIQLVTYDPFDGVRLGLTALPNAVAGAASGLALKAAAGDYLNVANLPQAAADGAGGLPISDAGGLDMDAASGITLSGTAAAGSSTSITLTGGVATDNYYAGQLVKLNGGTGIGQSRTILSYVGATTVATVTRDWAVAPDNTSTFSVHAGDIAAILEAGTAQAGAAASITLDASASAIADTYKNNFIMITAGTGLGQTRLISAYNGGTKVASVLPDWTTNPDATSVYQVLPAARVDVGGWAGALATLSTNSKPDVNVNEWKDVAVTTAVPDAAGTAATLHGVTDGKIDALVTPDAAGTAATLHGVTDGKIDALVTPDAAGTAATLHGVTDGKVDSVQTDVSAIKAITDALTAAAATKLAASAGTIVSAAAAAGTLSTTQMTTTLTEATDDHYNGRIVIWTSGVLQNQATDITDYDGSTKMLTYTAVTEAPSADDTFVIV